MLLKRICGSIGATALPRCKAPGLAPTVTPAPYVAERADCHVDAATRSMLCAPAVLARYMSPAPLPAGGGLVSARQPARAAPAAGLVPPLPTGARRPSGGRGLALVYGWVPMPRAQGGIPACAVAT